MLGKRRVFVTEIISLGSEFVVKLPTNFYFIYKIIYVICQSIQAFLHKGQRISQIAVNLREVIGNLAYLNCSCSISFIPNIVRVTLCLPENKNKFLNVKISNILNTV